MAEVEFTIEPVDCHVVIDEIAAALRPQAAAKGIGLTVHAPADLVMLATDRRALRQIVLNLVGNAVKFTDRGEVRLVLLPGAGGAHAEVRVEDTGKGIAPAEQDKLFAAFSRLDNRPDAPEGTGLGLHLSRKLAELLGGRIEFRSALGEGSAFSLFLPGPGA